MASWRPSQAVAAAASARLTALACLCLWQLASVSAAPEPQTQYTNVEPISMGRLASSQSRLLSDDLETTPTLYADSALGETAKLITDANLLEDTDRWNSMTARQNLFKIPDKPMATRVIVPDSAGDAPTTFLGRSINFPTSTEFKNGSDSKVIARYRIVLPVFLPAIKKMVRITTRKPVSYVKETITEQVPIEVKVPHIKETIRAERVGTEYTSSYGRELARVAADKIKPVGQIVSSDIQEFD